MADRPPQEAPAIRVNAIHPGIIGDTPFWQAKPEGVLDGYQRRTPAGKLATTQDVVDTTLFLLRAKGLSGQNLYVDRGWALT